MTKVCCICLRIEQEGKWSSGPLFAADLQVSHGFCPTCFAETMAEVSEFFAAHPQGSIETAGCPALVERWSPCV